VAQFPEEQLAQLDPTEVALPLSPLVLAEKTDISRRIFPPPQLGHFRPLPLVPTRQRRSITLSHVSQRNS
jgi:hypothetical protein